MNSTDFIPFSMDTWEDIFLLNNLIPDTKKNVKRLEVKTNNTSSLNESTKENKPLRYFMQCTNEEKEEKEETTKPPLKIDKKKFTSMLEKLKYVISILHKEPNSKHKPLLDEFVDKYFMEYVQFIINKINYCVGSINIYCLIFILNTMIFYHELKESYPTSDVNHHLELFIRHNITRCMKEEDGFGKVKTENKNYLKSNNLDKKNFKLFPSILYRKDYSLFRREHSLNIKSNHHSYVKKSESPQDNVREEPSRSHLTIMGKTKRTESFDDSSSNSTASNMKKSKGPEDAAERSKENESSIIKMLMEQNERLMKMVSQGQAQAQVQQPVTYMPLMPPPIHYQHPIPSYYSHTPSPHPIHYQHPSPPINYQYPPPPYQPYPHINTQYSVPDKN